MKSVYEVTLKEGQIVKVEADELNFEGHVVCLYLDGGVSALFSYDVFSHAIRQEDEQ